MVMGTGAGTAQLGHAPDKYLSATCLGPIRLIAYKSAVTRDLSFVWGKQPAGPVRISTCYGLLLASVSDPRQA